MVTITGLGSLPGVDARAAIGWTLESLPEHAYLPELPNRGVGADMIGRTASTLPGLGIDLQPSGWRLTGGVGGIDEGRAASWLRSDLDDLEELAQGYEGTVTISLAGPATLWTSLLLPRLERVLADPGARRDVAESLAQAVTDQVVDATRRVGGDVWFKIDDPAISAVLDGRIPSASGFDTQRAVERDELGVALGRVVDAARGAGAARVVLHSCASYPFDLARRAGVDAVSLDVTCLPEVEIDSLGGLLDAGIGVWLGAAATNLPNSIESPHRIVETAWRHLERMNVDPDGAAEHVLLTPACGLAGWEPDPARAMFRALATAASEIDERLAG